MRRQFLFGAVMAAAVAVSASAQSTSPTSQNPNNQPPTSQSPTPQSPATPSPESPTTQSTGTASTDYQSGQTVTLTGCLASADTWKGGTSGAPATGATGTTGSPTGATGAPGSTSASRSSGSGGFVLTDASMGASGGSSSSSYGGGATTGAAGTSGASSAAGNDAYTLQGKDDDLQKHMNHRVEVRGTLDKSSVADTSMTNPPSTGSTSAPGTKGTLTVSSVREISGSCSGGGNR